MPEEKLWSTQEVREALLKNMGFIVGVCQAMQENGMPLDSEVLRKKTYDRVDKVLSEGGPTLSPDLLCTYTLFPTSLIENGFGGTVRELVTHGHCRASVSILEHPLGLAERYCTHEAHPEDKGLVCLTFDRLKALQGLADPKGQWARA